MDDSASLQRLMSGLKLAPLVAAVRGAAAVSLRRVLADPVSAAAASDAP